MKQEDIIKVFALYLGQKVDNKGVEWNLDVDCLSYIERGLDGDGETSCKLLLKSLSSITDEEAIEVARMAHPDGENYTWEASPVMGEVTYVKAEGFRVAIWYDEAGVFIDRLTKECPTHNDHLITDYLRSRGFDLPTYFLGGKKPSEMGLAILKDNQ